MKTSDSEAFERTSSLWGRYYLYLAWVVALVATLGSLYFSEVAGYVPCQLCWYQRICMYPLAILLGMASYRGDRNISIYGLTFASVGWIISLYHNAEIWFPGLSTIAPCKTGIPCNVDYLNWFGFITIPLMALTAFTIIIAVLITGMMSLRR